MAATGSKSDHDRRATALYSGQLLESFKLGESDNSGYEVLEVEICLTTHAREVDPGWKQAKVREVWS
jgi:hypothetical protein